MKTETETDNRKTETEKPITIWFGLVFGFRFILPTPSCNGVLFFFLLASATDRVDSLFYVFNLLVYGHPKMFATYNIFKHNHLIPSILFLILHFKVVTVILHQCSIR